MRKISKYQLFTELQHGPITRVYKAIQPELQRVVLVKQLNPDLTSDDELVERFKQEGLILAKIKSPHVITIFDFGFDEGIPFLVTEFIEGNTLAGLIQQHGALPWDIGLFILQQLAQGLMAIHNQQIIHQDIKPENIFLSNDGEVKLGDLGFSMPLDQADQQIQGTPAYLAPEIIEGFSVDFRSDIYALGVVSYEVMTGENPFAADDIQTVLNRIANLKPINVQAIRSEVPQQLAAIISKLMHHKPDERFQSVKEFLQQLDNFKISSRIKVDSNSLINFLQEPEAYQPSQITTKVNSEPPVTKSRKRKPTIMTVGFIAIGLLVLVLIKQFDDGLSFFRKGNDIPITNSTQNSDQIKNMENVPINNSEQGTKKEPTLNTTEDQSKLPIGNDLPKDTLAIPAAVATKKDSVLITSDPKSIIFQNGKSLGITPVTFISELATDQLEIEFRTPGFPPIKKTVTILDQDVQKIHINLWKEVGYLDIDVVPWGAIWIDGDSIDISPINRKIILAPGKHELMVKHPALKNATELFYVAVGETVRKSIHLQRK